MPTLPIEHIRMLLHNYHCSTITMSYPIFDLACEDLFYRLIVLLLFIYFIYFFTDISQTRVAGQTQPVLRTFPRRLQGKGRSRAFTAIWYKDYTWIEYSQCQDTTHWFACSHFSLPSAPDTTFSSGLGISNWKKAMYKDGGFQMHAKSEHHLNAMVAWTEYKRCGRKQTVANVLLCTATQNIAQRGHRESEGSSNKGNFLAILELIAKHDPLVKQKMGHGNAKYTSHIFQNEIIEVLADMVSAAFSILVDETKDLKKQEQISLVLRYDYKGIGHERFMHFEHADKLDAAGLTEKIVTSLHKYGLEFREHLVGQGYDGASVMSGRHNGVSARMKLRLSRLFMCTVTHTLFTFLSGSYVHQKWQDTQRTVFHGQPRELPRLSDVRWACRFYACPNLMDRLPAVLRVLDEINGENNGDGRVEAHGLSGQIDLSFVGLLVVFGRILRDAKFLSDMLPSASLDSARAVDLIEELQNNTEMKHFSESCGQKRTVIKTKSLSVFCPILDTVGAELESSKSQKQQLCEGASSVLFITQTWMILSMNYIQPNGSWTEKSSQFSWNLSVKSFMNCSYSSYLEAQLYGQRSFSALKLIKNHLRSTMSNDRLSDFGVLSVESSRAEALDMDEFIQLFASRHGNRKTQMFS
uniref:DUF4371 domain-containing protein n=1 Tax=Stegastes partitus TaxID=144197 RepID=A0A3B5B968_9TELE